MKSIILVSLYSLLLSACTATYKIQDNLEENTTILMLSNDMMVAPFFCINGERQYLKGYLVPYEQKKRALSIYDHYRTLETQIPKNTVMHLGYNEGFVSCTGTCTIQRCEAVGQFTTKSNTEYFATFDIDNKYCTISVYEKLNGKLTKKVPLYKPDMSICDG